mmetsp:Transcript_22659/g.57788  ORF Transcript_22659/g.57788 Transcript_22659/m.57788 type:complete len:408 (-) Transcript_22659:129-1352(-)
MAKLALVVSALLFPWQSAVAGDLVDGLAADDECQAGDESCALNALQLRADAARLRAGNTRATKADEPEEPTTTEEKCQGQFQQCGGLQYEGVSTCCGDFVCNAKNDYYHQCVEAADVPLGLELTPELVANSEAPLFTFYVYRVMSNETYEPQNVNVANLAGVMWYLHNEVVIETPRKFNIMRIMRYKIQTKAPKPLFEAGMNFGVRYAFDMGQCTGPWYCGQMFQKYGYFVGCNDLGDFPYPDFPVYYPGAVWYSLPSTCPLKTYNYHDAACNKEQPGGHCDRTPDGTGTCTWNLEDAGEIWLDDLVNLDNYDEFVSNHGQEYDPFTDEGVGMTFWNGINDTKACANRVAKALALFEKEYPDDPKDADMPTPKCDFDFEKFYGHPYNATTGGAAAGNTTEHLDTAGR